LNKAFESGLQGKSEAIVGPFREAYFAVANDLFDKRIGPMIKDVDTRISGRLAQFQGIVSEAERAIDETLDKAKDLIEQTQGNVDKTIKETELAFDRIMQRVEQEIRELDCIVGSAIEKGDDIAKDIWGRFIFDALLGLAQPCNWKDDNVFAAAGDGIPSYQAAKRILNEKLESSKTVEEIKIIYARLAGVSSYYICKF
jgi:hypothetical protein